MSARPDVRQLGLGSAAPPGPPPGVPAGAGAQHPAIFARHPPHPGLSQRHGPGGALSATAYLNAVASTAAVQQRNAPTATTAVTNVLSISAANALVAAQQQQQQQQRQQQQQQQQAFAAAAAAAAASRSGGSSDPLRYVQYPGGVPNQHVREFPAARGQASLVASTTSASSLSSAAAASGQPRLTLRPYQTNPQSMYPGGQSSSSAKSSSSPSSSPFGSLFSKPSSSSMPPPTHFRGAPHLSQSSSWHSPLSLFSNDTTPGGGLYSMSSASIEAAGMGRMKRSLSYPQSPAVAAAATTVSTNPVTTSSSSPTHSSSSFSLFNRGSKLGSASFRSETASYLEAVAHHQQAIAAQQQAVAAAAAAAHAGIHLPIPASSSAASSVAAAAAAAAAAEIQPIPKRARIDLPHHHHPAGSSGPPPPSHSHAPPPGPTPPPPQQQRHPIGIPSNNPVNMATPLSIDTREVKPESGYHPQVEQISPTGPEASNDRADELSSTKDDLLQKITKVDREIAKAESQIAKLKKKQQELEEQHANKQGHNDSLSSEDKDKENEEDEKTKNQSIAQIIYAENRKRARASHMELNKFAPMNDLPLYNQPSDTDIYHENKRGYSHFKKSLVEHFKSQNEQKEARERYLTTTYMKMSAAWAKKVERIENSKKRKEREAKARELYEKIFPELRKQREDKERDHRLGSRGAVRSEADIEDVIERLQEQEMEDKKMHAYAVIPPLLLPAEERRRRFINNNGLLLDPLKEYSDRKFLNVWTDQEKEIFKDKFLLHGKNFGQIAQFLDRKSVSDCVQYYYLSKKKENYKQLMRRVKGRRGKRGVQQPYQSDVMVANVQQGVMTRNRRGELQVNNNNAGGDASKNDDNNASNRSTPQPKQEVKTENADEENEKKANRNKNTNDTSDEEDTNQGKTTHAAASKAPPGCCPILSCSKRGRMSVRERLRHLPKKYTTLPKENKEVVANDIQIPPHTKKCCSGCFQRITRRVNQLLGGSSCSSPADTTTNNKTGNANITSTGENLATSSAGANSEDASLASWSEEDIEQLKGSLKAMGKNWKSIAEKMANKTSEQCKKFYYNNKKKFELDKVVLEYKKATQGGDQATTVSSDEESGSSTSSCNDESAANANQTSSARNSPLTQTNAPLNADVKPAIKTEIKSEIKVEEGTDLTLSSSQTASTTSARPAVGVTKLKEEDNDSQATVSADEREGSADIANARGSTSFVGAPFPGQTAPFASGNIIRGDPRAIYPPKPRLNAPTTSSIVPTTNGPPRDTITVKELMINVIEKSLSTSSNAGQNTSGIVAGGISGSSGNRQLHGITNATSGNPTIHTLLENSNPTPINKGTPLLGRSMPHKGSMAPPPAPRPAPQASASSSGDCETLDLSLPRKRDPSPPVVATSISPSVYREPLPPPHAARRSPSVKSEYSSTSPQNTAPPPAHSGNKVKTNPDPFFRPEQHQAPSPHYFGSDSRPLSTQSAHLIHRSSSQSPGPRSQSRSPVGRPSSVQYMRHPQPLTQPPKGSPMSPNLSQIQGRSLTIQSGSITQGTPVNQGLPHRYDNMLKVTPPDKAGSITHGTPVYEKKPQQVINISDHPARLERAQPPPPSNDYFRRTISPGGSYPGYPGSVSASQSNRASAFESHLSSRQVLMNDYAMARSTEMQRRPDSRDHAGRSMSPSTRLTPDHARGRNVDPRLANDPRIQLDSRRDPRSFDHRAFDPRLITEHRGDPKAELRALDQRSDPRIIHEIRTDTRADPRVSLDPRGDPRTGVDHRDLRAQALEPRGDPRAVIDFRSDPRNDLRQSHDIHRRSASDLRADPRLPPAVAASGGIDPRSQIDPRDPRALRSLHYFPSGQQSQLILTDGKYVQTLRDPLPFSSRARSPSKSPSASAATLTQRPPSVSSSLSSTAASIFPRNVSSGGITSGKPIVASKPSTVSHREVEIYRTNPEVTISKTSSPRSSYNDHNPLASLVDVAVQQPKLPEIAARFTDKEKIALLKQHGLTDAHLRQVYERIEGRQPHQPSGTSTSQPSSSAAAAANLLSAQHIIQQVQTERAKQQFLMQDKERMERSFQPPASTAAKSSSSTDAAAAAAAVAAVSLAGMDDQTKMSAASLIDAIITQSINNGPPPDGGQIPASAKQNYKRSPAEMAASTPQEDAAAAAAAKAASPYKGSTRSPTSIPNGPSNSANDNSAPGSRPSSRPSSAAVNDYQAESAKDPGEHYWKRRGMMSANSSSKPSVSSADERQITRVSTDQDASRPRIETISPPNSAAPSTSTNKPGPASADNASSKLSANSNNNANGSNQSSGLSPLDYVKHKIVEEMRREPRTSSPNVVSAASTSPRSSVASPPTSSVSAGVKRPAEAAQDSSTSNGDDKAKKQCVENDFVKPQKEKQESNNAPVIANSPDSPGSEGEMVIDESVGSSNNTESSNGKAANNNSSTSAAEANTSSTPQQTSTEESSNSAVKNDNSQGLPSAQPSSSTSKPPPPQYEPLSDDE